VLPGRFAFHLRFSPASCTLPCIPDQKPRHPAAAVLNPQPHQSKSLPHQHTFICSHNCLFSSHISLIRIHLSHLIIVPGKVHSFISNRLFNIAGSLTSKALKKQRHPFLCLANQNSQISDCDMKAKNTFKKQKKTRKVRSVSRSPQPLSVKVKPFGFCKKQKP